MPRPIRKEKGDSVMLSPETKVQFFSSGCTVLDLMLGGGWPLGRIFNIVGDRSTGKTLLAIEACANFTRKFPKGRMWYREAESAFDEAYAESIGMPVNKISFIDREKHQFDTVEDFHDDLNKQCEFAQSKGGPGLYLLDSLDALTDESELKRGIDEKSYGANKSKKLSELFRRCVRKIEQAEIALGIISQVRANIGVSFGRKTTRSGGKALDFYTSQIIYVSHLETLYRTVMNEKMAYGIRVRVKCDKNKVGQAARECEFPIYFNYGIEDLVASLDFLIRAKCTDEIGMSEEKTKKVIRNVPYFSNAEYEEHRKAATHAVKLIWHEREDKLRMKRKKYD